MLHVSNHFYYVFLYDLNKTHVHFFFLIKVLTYSEQQIELRVCHVIRYYETDRCCIHLYNQIQEFLEFVMLHDSQLVGMEGIIID